MDLKNLRCTKQRRKCGRGGHTPTQKKDNYFLFINSQDFNEFSMENIAGIHNYEIIERPSYQSKLFMLVQGEIVISLCKMHSETLRSFSFIYNITRPVALYIPFYRKK